VKKKFELIKVPRRDMIYQNEIYVPKHGSDIDISRGIDIGQSITGSTSKADVRNLGHHKKMFALIKCVFHNLPEKFTENRIAVVDDEERVIPGINSVEDLREELKMQVGSKKIRMTIGGHIYYETKSWSHATMGQEEFSELYSKVLDFVFEYILPNVDKAEFEKQILGFM
jgi:hypothetical protein